MGKKPLTITCYIGGNSPCNLVEKYFMHRDEILVQLKLNLIKAHACMKKLADKHRSKLELVVEDWYLLSLGHIIRTLCAYTNTS